MPWNEDSLHRWLFETLVPRGLAASFGNDAAVLARELKQPVVCVDQTIEGVHYESGAPPAQVGRKACARTLSDLAASAARPRAVLAALCAPPDRAETWIRSVLRSIASTAREYDAELVGGDLACARGPAWISVTAIGELASGGRPVARDRARAGQIVVLTGPVGGSRLGRHLDPKPRVEAGLWLARCGASAMMDTSDGLALDLERLARASGVRIDLERVPVHGDALRLAKKSGRSALEHALTDGEDHELIATLSKKDLGPVLAGEARHCPGLSVIGRVRRGAGLWVPAAEPSRELVPWTGGGWIHGAR